MLHSATEGASPYAVSVTSTAMQKQNIKNTLS